MTAPSADPVPLDLEGNWTGTWSSTGASAAGGTLSMSFVFVYPNGVGIGYIHDSPCFFYFDDVEVSVTNPDFRTISGTMRLSAGDNSVRVFFFGAISNDGTTFEGSYSVHADMTPCHLDGGVVTMTRASPARANPLRIRVYDRATGVQVLDIVR